MTPVAACADAAARTAARDTVGGVGPGMGVYVHVVNDRP